MRAERPDITVAGFATLGVPLFFCLFSLSAGLVGMPLALLAAPAIFRFALVIVPPPSRLTLPMCPYRARREARRAVLRTAGKVTDIERPEAQRIIDLPVAPLPARRRAHAVAFTDTRAAA